MIILFPLVFKDFKDFKVIRVFRDYFNPSNSFTNPGPWLGRGAPCM